MASPIPRVAPVTRATRPRRRPDFAVLLEVDAVKKVEGDLELSYLTDRTPPRVPHPSDSLRMWDFDSIFNLDRHATTWYSVFTNPLA